MSDRTCSCCGKVFKYPCHLRRHRNRKTSCRPCLVDDDKDINNQKNELVAVRAPYVCECGCTYKYRQNLYRHRQHCNKHNTGGMTNKGADINNGTINMTDSHDTIMYISAYNSDRPFTITAENFMKVISAPRYDLLRNNPDGYAEILSDTTNINMANLGIELMKLAHKKDPSSRSICINPKRQDQVMINPVDAPLGTIKDWIPKDLTSAVRDIQDTIPQQMTEMTNMTTDKKIKCIIGCLAIVSMIYQCNVDDIRPRLVEQASPYFTYIYEDLFGKCR